MGLWVAIWHLCPSSGLETKEDIAYLLSVEDNFSNCSLHRISSSVLLKNISFTFLLVKNHKVKNHKHCWLCPSVWLQLGAFYLINIVKVMEYVKALRNNVKDSFSSFYLGNKDQHQTGYKMLYLLCMFSNGNLCWEKHLGCHQKMPTCTGSVMLLLHCPIKKA